MSTEGTAPEKGKNSKNKQRSKASRAIELTAQARAQLFHDPDGEPYADVWDDEGTRQTIRIRSRAFRSWLSGLMYAAEGSALGGQAATDAVDVLSAMAVHGGSEREIHTRLARGPDGEVFLDLGDDSWRAVQVTPDGWGVVTEPPVRFRRPRGLRSLPTPVEGGSVADLQPLLNLRTARDRILVAAWLIGTLHPDGPYPVLPLSGEQGSAKTTAAKILRYLVDPNEVPLRTLPREERDLVIAGRNGLVVAIDNVSHLRTWVSDALCRMATGGGFSARELYTDGDEVIFAAKRPVLLTGIEDVAVRGDLADRAIPVELPRIPEEDRRTEAELWREVDRIRPRVLGALLDAVSVGLRRLPEVQLDRLPRMADFARWVVACEPALPWDAGAFLSAYADAREGMVEMGIEADPVAMAVRELMNGTDEWQGTASALLDALNGLRSKDARPPKGWPETPQAIGGRMIRAAPLLRRVGLEVERGEHLREAGTGRRLMRVARAVRDNPGGVCDNVENSVVTPEPLSHKACDNRDDCDDLSHTRANGPPDLWEGGAPDPDTDPEAFERWAIQNEPSL